MEELYNIPIEKWTESMVGKWLQSIGVKEQYIKKLHDEEVDGQILLEITEDFLKKETGMKSGPAHLIITKRNELVRMVHKVQGQHDKMHVRNAEKSDQRTAPSKGDSAISTAKKGKLKRHSVQTKMDSKPRPFCKSGSDFTYVQHNVLQPESGPIDLITPCHEYKAFTDAATLDCPRIQAKLANEVFKFATGCINIRSNGTIHFGVMDGQDDSSYVHGEIIGVPIQKKSWYVDALNLINRSFSTTDTELIQQCIRPPEFVPVSRTDNEEERYVVEFDIVPSISIVRNKMFSVRLPNFRETSNKIELEKETIYCRQGSRTTPVDANVFYQGIQTRDAYREGQEQAQEQANPEVCQDLGRKLIMLVTSGKKIMQKEKWYILVTNRFPKKDLDNINFLLNMNIFCVFDFDPDSKVSGLCQEYDKHHAVNVHFMQNYKPPSGMSIREFESHLHLFEQISWIFCNGRSDFKGNEPPCDEHTWSKTRRTFLKDCVSLLCKDILPKGTFLVIFLLTSPVETPLLNTFYEFFTDMEGHEDIICISESEENFQKWKSFALGSCEEQTVNDSSVVGMKMSHINATLQRIQTTTIRAAKLLPVHFKGECYLEKREEEMMCSLEILSSNQCEDTIPEVIDSQKEDIERQFYLGGKVTWMNFWLAEKKYVGDLIHRDAYHEVTNLLKDSRKWSPDQLHIHCINIYHHPGSGGSTVARQVLWNHKKELRCAVVKTSYSVNTVSEHAVKLWKYEEKDPQKSLPILLLIEDCDKEYIEDLKNELEMAVYAHKIPHGTVCFILLSCRRSYSPEKMCKASPLQNVSVTHKLSEEEKRHFARKRQTLEQHFSPEFILTFILMSEEFEHKTIATYVKQFVEHLLQDIDHASVVTQLICYVALLNTYVQNSFISQSHCEDLLALSVKIKNTTERFRQHTFEGSLSDQAKLVFIHLRDEKTHIQSIRIIHPLVAKEILHQLLGYKRQQSDLALELLNNDVLFEHRFGREDYMKFLRALFMRRYRISRGDKSDSLFSPLIEHVRKNEKPEKAIELLKEAYKRFNKDAFFAQQIARLSYKYENFEHAEHWADIAATKQPNNSYILDTKGQVYRRWFIAKCKAVDSQVKTPENTAKLIETALKAMECFEASEKAAVEDAETMNNSGFFATVEVGCSLLELIFSLRMFSNKMNGHSECVKYLVTEHIPKEIEKPWKDFHYKLKSLQATMQKSLEWISEDLSYFQTDISADEETSETVELKIRHPKSWLVNKSSVYGKFFSNVPVQYQSDPAKLTPFSKRMIINRLGGGNITTIFCILDKKDKKTEEKDKKTGKHDEKSREKEKDAVDILEEIISLYPKNPAGAKMDQVDIVNCIASHIALSTASTHSSKLAPLNDLRRLSRQFPQDKSRCMASSLFLSILLYWPEEHDNDDEKESKYETILSAVDYLQPVYWKKMKDIPRRRRRIYTHFFLGHGVGYDKFVHKSKIEITTELSSVSEKRLRWLHGELFRTPEIAKMLKRVSGWTENGNVYLEGPKKKKLPIQALYVPSVPYGNENVSFYLGFTFRGPVAYDITVRK
ncbi:sterile alpha motif domain-containing protein 9-like isoform X2 [Salminus brasiliensis]|uniref:sterile alpha motif domain-containing protein 9-like isoform X2 n=1 Tax=Salminus brasiliensis TaxID=930266 RepID=UPI003B8355F3